MPVRGFGAKNVVFFGIRMPAAAARQASAVAALPVDAHATVSWPYSTAFATTSREARSLVVPDGLRVSSFTHRCGMPRWARRRGTGRRGVPPTGSGGSDAADAIGVALCHAFAREMRAAVDSAGTRA